MRTTKKESKFGCWTKNTGFLHPKWMVKIMEKPNGKFMIWGYPYFFGNTHILGWPFFPVRVTTRIVTFLGSGTLFNKPSFATISGKGTTQEYTPEQSTAGYLSQKLVMQNGKGTPLIIFVLRWKRIALFQVLLPSFNRHVWYSTLTGTV